MYRFFNKPRIISGQRLNATLTAGMKNTKKRTMDYTKIRPNKALEQFIEFFWNFEGEFSDSVTYKLSSTASINPKLAFQYEKGMAMCKEGMEETITAKLYTAPKNYPLNFHTYVPPGYNVESFDTGEGKIVSFKRNEADLKLIVLPKSIENRAGAMQMAKKYVENVGDAKEMENGFQLTSSNTTALTTEVGEKNGYYYIWLSQSPLEYGDGFGPESHFIKQNLKWN